MFAKIVIDDARVAAFTTISGKAIRVPASSRQSDPYQRNPPEGGCVLHFTFLFTVFVRHIDERNWCVQNDGIGWQIVDL